MNGGGAKIEDILIDIYELLNGRMGEELRRARI
jgi:hypothetical protein